MRRKGLDVTDALEGSQTRPGGTDNFACDVHHADREQHADCGLAAATQRLQQHEPNLDCRESF
jgi:hypothetical protein